MKELAFKMKEPKRGKSPVEVNRGILEEHN